MSGKTERKVVLVGHSNVGKSVIFNCLTGKYATVSNYPGTTVEVASGKVVGTGGPVRVMDTPGISSLTPLSDDERVTRDVVLDGPVDLVVQVADGKNLGRSLVLSAQLAELGLPLVIDVNMVDEARERGLEIGFSSLEASLGVPVVPTVATHREGIERLVAVIGDGSPRTAQVHIPYDSQIEEAIAKLAPHLKDGPLNPRGLAILALTSRNGNLDWVSRKFGPQTCAQVAAMADELQSRLAEPLDLRIARRRRDFVVGLLKQVVTYPGRNRSRAATSARATPVEAAGPRPAGAVEAGERCAHEGLRLALAVGMLAAAAALLFQPISLFGYSLAWIRYPMAAWAGWEIACWLVAHKRNAFSNATTHPVTGGLILLGIVYLVYRFVGIWGAGTLTGLLENGVFGRGINPGAKWLFGHLPIGGFLRDMVVGHYGLITMGVTYSIAIVLPTVLTFFIAFGILEDSGYLPRLASLANRSLRPMGLNGRAVLPMVLGLGCGTMAVLTTRILESKRERTLATLLIGLAIPCSAQLGVITGVAASISWKVVAVLGSTVLFHLMLVGLLAGRLMQGDSSDFVLELPPLRMPQLANVWQKTKSRSKWYLTEAVPLFLYGTLFLFLLDRARLLGGIITAFQPVTHGLLGLPPRAAEAFVMGFLRRDYGAVVTRQMALGPHPEMDPLQVAVSLVVVVLLVPCIAAMMMMFKERGRKVGAAIILFVIAYAILAGTALRFLLQAVHFGA